MLLRTITLASVALLVGTPGNAATYYVAQDGQGSLCTVAGPCNSLATALGNITAGDTIICESPPAPGGIKITKSVTIDCSSAHAPVRDGGFAVNGSTTVVSIAVAANDPFQTVILRGLDIDGSLPGSTRTDRGIDISAVGALYIEDCILSNFQKTAILDHRTGGQTRLYIKDATMISSAGPSIVAAAGAPGIVVLDHVTSQNNAYGFAAAAGNNVSIDNSIFSGNSVAGIEGDSGAQITVYNSKISHNNIGVQSTSSVRLSNNNIEFNNTAFSGSSGTQGSNRYSANTSMGTAPMPISGAPADIGP